ncbi:MAG: Hsp33 family molecular chaperone HslO [Candidatus Pacebacteria bacterium]|nr:Hsp33 family molecular chaperone HslO [Candidatus Paceibacterota bacterium]
MGHWNPDGSWQDTPADNIIRPFHFGAVRGRLVRLGSVLDEILNRHDYPPTVAQILGEVMILGCCLASSIKLEGIFTIQLRGNGPISLLVADMATGGEFGLEDQQMALRGFAQYEWAKLPREERFWRDWVGDGTLSFTVDQLASGERYQGIVELTGESLAQSAAHYFTQSEQLGTAIELECQPLAEGWRGGAIMVQQIAAEGGVKSFTAPSDDNPHLSLTTEDEDEWNRAQILLQSCRDVELLDSELSADDLLFRLFHLELVKVLPQRRVIAKCRCSEQRIRDMLQSFPPEDRKDLSDDGVIQVTCEFCNREYRIEEG